MAKSLKEILAGSKASKKEKLKLGEKPGVDYAPKAKEEQDFVAKHEIEKFSDRVGNGDEAYKATTVKHAQTEKDPHGHKSRKDEKVNEDSYEDGNYLAEGTVISKKVVMNQRGGEDHYEMHHHGTGSTGWHSIIKTHQDGRSLMNDHGGYNAMHVGSEKYVAQKWKGITHQKLLPADHPMRKNWRETPDAAPVGKLSAVKEEIQHKVGDKVAIERGKSQILGTVSKIDSKFTHVRSGNMTHEVGHHMVKLREEDLAERDTSKEKEDTVLVTDKTDKKATKTGGGVKRIKKSEYDEKKHSLAEDQEQLDEISKGKAIKTYGKAGTEYDELASDKSYAQAARLLSHIKKKFGDGAAKHATDAASVGYYGRQGDSPGKDKLAYSVKPRVNASGKVNQQDVNKKKNQIKGRLGIKEEEIQIELKDYLRAIANRAMHAVFETENMEVIDESLLDLVEAIKVSLDCVNDSIVESKVK